MSIVTYIQRYLMDHVNASCVVRQSMNDYAYIIIITNIMCVDICHYATINQERNR